MPRQPGDDDAGARPRRPGRPPQQRAPGRDGRDERDGAAGRGTRDDRPGNRARAREEAAAARQPYRPPRKPAPRRPDLPDERPVLPRDAWRDLRATVSPALLDDVVKAVGAAGDALDAGDPEQATQLLTWAKSVAPRTATIREALGLTHYAAQRYPEAHSELLAYRRLSAAQDQNHVLADCARAAGRADKVREYVEEMLLAQVDPGRSAEGLIVLASDRADHGDLEGALETLRRAGLDPQGQVQPWHPRLWYVAGDLSDRLGRRDDAREYFEAILAVDDEFGDVEERLAALD